MNDAGNPPAPGAPGEEASDSQPPTRWLPSPGRLALWVVATVVIWAIAAGVLLWNAQEKARSGEEALRTVADLSDPADIDLDEVLVALRSGGSDVSDARSTLGSPLLYPLRPLPFVGRQFQSSRALAKVTDDIVSELEPLVEEARAVRADPNSVDRVDFLRSMAVRLERLDATIKNSDLGPDEALLEPLADARVELDERLLELSDQAQVYGTIASGMASFLDERHYLVLGSNNSEMRLGSGMHLSVGELTTEAGEFDLPGLTPSSDLDPVVGADVLDTDVRDRWGFLDLASDFRRLGYSGRFDEHVGPQALEMWQKKTGRELDGVLLLDPFVLDALLGVIGDVELDGQSFSQGTALSYLLQDQYAVFAKDETAERQDRLSVLASAVVEKFGSSSWDPIELLDQLKPMAEGRHIMAYSTDPAEQAAWAALTVDGSLTGQETGVFLLNTGASKLDPFVDVSVDITTTLLEDVRAVEMTIVLENRASPDLPRYVLGPYPKLDLEPADYSGRLAIYVPRAVTDAGFDGDVRLDAFGPDGPVLVASTSPVTVAAGERRTFAFTYSLPADQQAIELLPSGRFPAERWTWDGRRFDDSVRRTITLSG